MTGQSQNKRISKLSVDSDVAFESYSSSYAQFTVSCYIGHHYVEIDDVDMHKWTIQRLFCQTNEIYNNILYTNR